MNRQATRRRGFPGPRRACLALLSLLAAGALAACDALSPYGPGGELLGADLNPGRGFHQWRGLQVVPPHRNQAPAAEIYQRFVWWNPDDPAQSLESAAGSYDFGPITRLFDDNPQARVSFRIRSFVDYRKAYVPPYLQAGAGWWADSDPVKDGQADCFVPDWNSPLYLNAVSALMQALRAELLKPGPDGRPRLERLGWIDLSLYGQYGEWYLRTHASGDSRWIDYGQAPGGMADLAAMDAQDPANPRRRLADAQLSAFPEARWLMFLLWDQRELLDYLFNRQSITSLEPGWRFDGLGASDFLKKQWEDNAEKLSWWDGSHWAPAGSAEARAHAFGERWRLGPVVAEFYGPEASLDQALDQVRAYRICMVSNGNFSPVGGSDAAQWASETLFRQATLRAIGRSAGWRLEALGNGWLGGDAQQWRWRITVANRGSAPAHLDILPQPVFARGEGSWQAACDPGLSRGINGLAGLEPGASLELELVGPWPPGMPAGLPCEARLALSLPGRPEAGPAAWAGVEPRASVWR